ncbi:Crp/Fnr family transcriptional regulator [Sphingobacterium sp. SGG-5]|uniref:Crp/Fnr family transcriptional regulator n=1 Tax=Sphingobacterium sp. SGG-5 TaxID=2710881 RepID=UPI0013ED48C8|nr:Crp/Fnr family transcriptional regulator [Sphingobacterium sp. SGG-5]NGM62797.1 Crp/Fnr family transcriptional regulator [Sphingobacterium sp. SGG-5]
MIDRLIQHINGIMRLTEQEELTVRELVREKTLKRKQFLHRVGEVAQYSAFVVDGCLRSYAIDQNGFEHILQFAPENWWISDMYSFVKNQPSELNIDALLPTNVLLLSRSCQLSIFDRIPKLERYFRILTENALASSNHRTIDYLSLPAKIRYQKFCTLYPTLIHTIPQKYIASYIGITPEFLSKLRSEY